MNKKTVFPILVGSFIFAFVAFSTASQFNTLRTLFTYSGSGALNLKIQAVLTFLLPIAFGVIAILSKRYKVLIFPVMVYLSFQDIGYAVNYITNYKSLINGINIERILEYSAVVFLEVALILSIVEMVVCKVFSAPSDDEEDEPRENGYGEYNGPQELTASQQYQIEKIEKKYACGEISSEEYNEQKEKIIRGEY